MNPSLMIGFATTDDNAHMAQGAILFVALIFIYFIPAIAAHKKPQSGSVLALNFFLGWTFVGWVVALAWALKNPERQISGGIQVLLELRSRGGGVKLKFHPASSCMLMHSKTQYMRMRICRRALCGGIFLLTWKGVLFFRGGGNTRYDASRGEGCQVGETVDYDREVEIYTQGRSNPLQLT
jgi:hypothetical protein